MTRHKVVDVSVFGTAVIRRDEFVPRTARTGDVVTLEDGTTAIILPSAPHLHLTPASQTAFLKDAEEQHYAHAKAQVVADDAEAEGAALEDARARAARSLGLSMDFDAATEAEGRRPADAERALAQLGHATDVELSRHHPEAARGFDALVDDCVTRGMAEAAAEVTASAPHITTPPTAPSPTTTTTTTTTTTA